MYRSPLSIKNLSYNLQDLLSSLNSNLRRLANNSPTLRSSDSTLLDRGDHSQKSSSVRSEARFRCRDRQVLDRSCSVVGDTDPARKGNGDDA